MMRSTFALLGALVALALVPAAASATTLQGTVVHRNPGAHAFVVAGSNGTMRTVHGTQRVRVGWVVRVRARWLRNGTWEAQRVAVAVRRRGATAHASGRKWASACAGGRARPAGRKWAALRGSRRRPAGRKWAAVRCTRSGIRGTVTHVDPRSGALTVSGGGSSVLVTGPARAARMARSAAALPKVGTVVRVTAALAADGPPMAQAVRVLGQNTAGVAIGVIVRSVDPDVGTVTVSADDLGLSADSIVLLLPPGFSAEHLVPGRQATMRVVGWGAGGLQLLYSSGNDSAREADDPSDDHGPPPVPPGLVRPHDRDGQGDDASDRGDDASGDAAPVAGGTDGGSGDKSRSDSTVKDGGSGEKDKDRTVSGSDSSSDSKGEDGSGGSQP